MCLSKLCGFKVRLDENGEGVGYKAFYLRIKNNRLYSLFFAGKAPRKTNVWLRAKKKKIEDFEDNWYPDSATPGRTKMIYYSGFHIFTRKNDARRFIKIFYETTSASDRYPYFVTVRKVKFRKILATGLQAVSIFGKNKYARTVVAEEMKILDEEVKNEKM